MKQLAIGIILIILSSSGLLAQQWTTSGTNIYNSNTGNVGIGTTSPIYQLDINRTGGANLGAWARLGSIYAVGEASGSYPSIGYNINSNSSSFKYAATDFASWIKFQAGGLQFHTAPSGTSGGTITSTQVMGILQNGNVGIGTTAPASLFDVFGKSAGGNVDINFRNQPGVNTSGTRTNMNFPVFNGAPGLQISEMTASTGGFNVGNYDALISTGQGSSYLHLAAGSARTPQMTLKFTGDVGIGTTTPQARLDVNGSAYSRKLFVGTPDANTAANMGNNLLAVDGSAVFKKVTVKATLWPDYVFNRGYELPSLEETESYIQTHQHLPGVPSAAEVEKNGIDLGANQATLLKKIEELTLFAIEQNKRSEKLLKIADEQNKLSEKLQKTIGEQDKRNEEQSRKILELEKKLNTAIKND